MKLFGNSDIATLVIFVLSIAFSAYESWRKKKKKQQLRNERRAKIIKPKDNPFAFTSVENQESFAQNLNGFSYENAESFANENVEDISNESFDVFKSESVEELPNKGYAEESAGSFSKESFAGASAENFNDEGESYLKNEFRPSVSGFEQSVDCAVKEEKSSVISKFRKNPKEYILFSEILKPKF